MRAFGGFASKIAPRISRGIGQQADTQEQQADTQELQLDKSETQEQQLILPQEGDQNETNEVEQGAETAANIGGDIQNRLG